MTFGSLFSAFVLFFVLNLSLSRSLTLVVLLGVVLAVCKLLVNYSKNHTIMIGSHHITLGIQLVVFCTMAAPYLLWEGLLGVLVPSLCSIATLTFLHRAYCSAQDSSIKTD